jgi:hypothetical protein
VPRQLYKFRQTEKQKMAYLSHFCNFESAKTSKSR